MTSIYENLINANNLALLYFRNKQYEDAFHLMEKVKFGFENHYPYDLTSMNILEIQLSILSRKNFTKDLFIPSLSLNNNIDNNNKGLLLLSNNLLLLSTPKQETSSKQIKKINSINNTCIEKNCIDCLYIEQLEKYLKTINKDIDGKILDSIYSKISNIINALVKERDFKKVENITCRFINLFEKYFGKKNKIVLYLYDDLSIILYKNNKLLEAEYYIKHSSIGFEETFGLDNENTAKSVVNYGNILYLLEKYQEAEILYKKGLISFEYVYGKESIKLNIVLENLAKVYEKLGDLEKTEFLCNQIIELYIRKKNPKYEINIYEIKVNLTRILVRLTKYDEAELYAKETITKFEKQFGKKDKRSLLLLKIYEKILLVNNKSIQAIPISIQINNLHLLPDVFNSGNNESSDDDLDIISIES